MDELENVINGLECQYEPRMTCYGCYYFIARDKLCNKNKIFREAVNLLKAQEPGWISADNRPPSQGNYLVYGLTNFVPDHIDQPNAYWEVKIAYWSDRFGWDGKVKYWMPLPEQPKES